ncbi:MAG TPA: histidine kinase [Thermoanaerobaculia bacterium]|nr:histidine kinase [Thermoanaerobaculia bacterium]
MNARRFRMLLLIAACDLAIWVVAGLFATSEFYRRAIVLGGGVAWNEVLLVQMVTALDWALLTPVVVLIAQRLPLRPPHLLRNAAIILALIPILAVFRAAFGGAFHSLGEGHGVALSFVLLSVRIRFHRNVAILAVIFFISNLVDAQREAAARERQRVRAQTLLARAEMDELRTRLQPQFAVRMLRHIGSVLHAEPGDRLIVSLSEIVRRSMTRGSREQTRLSDELEHFDHCLDLCRAGGRFAVNARYVASDDVLACLVPALVLQPVIEAVVLDLTSGSGGSVEVHCAHEGRAVRMDVEWTVTPDGGAMSTTLRVPFEEAA